MGPFAPMLRRAPVRNDLAGGDHASATAASNGSASPRRKVARGEPMPPPEHAPATVRAAGPPEHKAPRRPRWPRHGHGGVRAFWPRRNTETGTYPIYAPNHPPRPCKHDPKRQEPKAHWRPGLSAQWRTEEGDDDGLVAAVIFSAFSRLQGWWCVCKESMGDGLMMKNFSEV